MKHFNLDHFQVTQQREAADWWSILALVLLVSCVYVWAAILGSL